MNHTNFPPHNFHAPLQVQNNSLEMLGGSNNKNILPFKAVVCLMDALENSSVKTIYYNYLNNNLYIDMQRTKLSLLKFN